MAAALRIVVVEDHHALREVIVELLVQKGYQVIGVECAEALDDEAGGELIDLLVVDLNLPGEDGISLVRRVREVQPEIGIIMVTARNAIEDRIAGYQSGADIYLPKPIDPIELLAAVDSLARRLSVSSPSTVSGQQSLLLDTRKQSLSSERATVKLSSSETALLIGLARAHQQFLEYWQVVELLGLELDNFHKSALDVRISRLRQKMTRVTDRECLQTQRGRGYQLVYPVSIH